MTNKRTSELPKPFMRHSRTYGGRTFYWDFPRLRLGQRGRIMAVLIRDSEYPDLWRIDDEEGISDMLNLTRAKDAAMSRSIKRLNYVK
jgi:hypothetical protein